jgi:monoamine oxidase
VTAAHRCDVVVGAGIAGLRAAHSLAAAGRTVRVYEARDRVGGRVHSTPADAGAVDLGATWFWPNESAIRALSDELHVGTFPQALRGDALFEPDERGVQRIGGNPIDVPSSRFIAGAQDLALRLADRLPPGALRLNDPVSAVHLDTDGVVVAAASGAMSADHVVLALPPALAVETISFTPELPAAVHQVAEATAVWMGSVVKAIAVYDTPFWRRAGLAGAAISHLGPFRELHDHSGPDGAPAAVFGFAAAEQFQDASTDQIAAAFTAQLIRLFGSAAGSPRQIHVTDWSRERHTTPQAPSPRATTATYGHRLLRQAVAGRLHWASTETSAQYPGHIEGALDAGARAARAITSQAAATNGGAPTSHAG